MKTTKLIAIALLLLVSRASAQLTVEITAVPATTPPGVTVYIAGDFNRWNPAAPEYRLSEQPGRRYTITLPDSVRGPIEFKFTLGAWESVETSASGGDVANRTFTVPATGTVTYTTAIQGWRNPKTVTPRVASASASVSILSTEFEMPQLGRARRVWIYLPPDYATSKRRYPVLYMHDGQNVFDAATSFAGEWGVDEALDSLIARGDSGVIVVATDHGGAKRFDEYSPWKNERYGGGEGDGYVEFIVKTLKPHIDQRYRTRPDARNTAIAGSSMGGLISLYAALKYPNVFGKAGVFSPALWIAPALVTFAREYAADPTRSAHRPRLYFVAATDEAQRKEQLAVSQPLMEALTAAGYKLGNDLTLLEKPDGAHSEWFWRREFPAAYLWLSRN
jgi:metallo-beta-lactamase class B